MPSSLLQVILTDRDVSFITVVYHDGKTITSPKSSTMEYNKNYRNFPQYFAEFT